MNNVSIERLKSRLERKEIYPREYVTVIGLDQGVERCKKHDNTERPHQVRRTTPPPRSIARIWHRQPRPRR